MFHFTNAFSLIVSLIFVVAFAILGIALILLGLKLLRRGISNTTTQKTFMFVDGKSANGKEEVPPEVTSVFQSMNEMFKTVNETMQGNEKPDFVAVTCPHCGASCRIPAEGGQCEYCNSHLNGKA